MIGMLYGCELFDGEPRVAIVAATHDLDATVPEGFVRVMPVALSGMGIAASPQVVPLVDAPPGDGSPGFVRAS